MPLTKIMPITVLIDAPVEDGLNQWTMRCGNCGQTTTTFYNPNGDNWVLGYIRSAHADCKWWEKYRRHWQLRLRYWRWLKRRLFKLFG